jgi:glycosyltransferase involved in cell wall biosynthesis
MRRLLSSEHRYPSYEGEGSGPHPKAFPSGSGAFIHDLIVKGLSELGHDVFYLLREGISGPLPAGATWISEPIEDVDLLHTTSYHDHELVDYMQTMGKPWVTTCHLDLRARGREQSETTDNWIFVSRTLARTHGRTRYVLNGVDPSDYFYSEAKDDYFLFMSSMDWGLSKGLDVAISLSKRMGFKLVVAGTGKDYDTINKVAEMCKQSGALYVGDVRGKSKAELLAGANALLFPTKVNEAFGLGMVEALMSGTPVISSDKGACPEIISPDVGFVCKSDEEYEKAVSLVSDISPRACREKAMREYHYLRMAADYVTEYQKEIPLS